MDFPPLAKGSLRVSMPGDNGFLYSTLDESIVTHDCAFLISESLLDLLLVGRIFFHFVLGEKEGRE